jgi:hypothetical protein
MGHDDAENAGFWGSGVPGFRGVGERLVKESVQGILVAGIELVGDGWFTNHLVASLLGAAGDGQQR